MASVANCVSKYFLSAYEFYRAGQRGGENAPPWENKSMWVFYVELMTGTCAYTLTLAFVDNMLSRFFEVDYISCLLHHHNHILRASTKYRSRRLHNRPLICI
jgi:hypothetical protein